MLNQLCSVHAVCASIVLNMWAPEGTAFEPCQDFPGDLRAWLPTDLGFTLAVPPPKVLFTCAELARQGMQRPGMSAYEP